MDNFNRALDAHRRGKIDQAHGLYRRVLGKSPRHAGALMQLGLIEQSRGNIDEAHKLLEKAARIEPDNPSVQNCLGQILLAQDRHDEAAAAFRAATTSEPRYGAAWQNLGLVLATQRNFDAAVDCFRQALATSPSDAKLLLNLGHALGETGAFEEAAEVLLRAVRLQPAVPQLRLALGDVLIHAGEAAKAIHHYREVERLVPGNAAGPHRLALALLQIGDVDGAIDALKRAQELAAESVAIKCDLANAYALSGAHEPAQDLFAEVAKTANQAATIGVAARGLIAAGGIEMARRILAQAVKTDRTDPEIAVARAELAADVSDLDEAKSGLEQAIEGASPSQNAMVLYALAETHHRRGQFDSAFEYASKANGLKNARFDAEAEAALVDRIVDITKSGVGAVRQGRLTDEPNLVFAVGMQRSGLQLLERLLSLHPKVAGLGAAGAFQATVNAIEPGGFGYLDLWDQFEPDALNELAASHIRRVRGRTDAAIVIEAVPGNLFYVGLIYRLFPNAQLLLCRRDLADLCLSSFFQDFAGASPYAYDLHSLGHHARSAHRLTEFWRDHLNDRLQTVDFGALLHSPEETLKPVCEALNLSEPASARNQIDSRRVSWRKRHTDYLHHLGPLMSLLDLKNAESTA